MVVQGREYYVFWNHAEWVRMIDARTETADLPPALVLRTDAGNLLPERPVKRLPDRCAALWLVRAYDYLLYAAMDAVQRGEIAPLGMGAMVQKLFLEGATDVRG